MKKKCNIDLISSVNKEVLTKQIKDLSLHDLTKEHPEMVDSEFQRLKESIAEVGQIEPILIYRGKIVDGRHRFWAIESLGLDYILANEITFTTPLDTVREIVFGSEVRRHQTPTQKAIKAYWSTQEDGITYRAAEKKFMTSRTMISACRYIDEIKGGNMLKDLYNGIPISIGKRKTSSLRTAQNLIKEEEEAAKDARFEEEKYISIDKANEEAKLFLDALKREPTPVIERVASGAYAMLKKRE